MALAAAFEVDIQQITQHVPLPVRIAAPDSYSGLSSRQATWLGAALCLWPLLFVLGNIGYYELGIDSARYLLPTSDLAKNPLLLPGGLMIGLMINLPHLIGLSLRKSGDALLFNGLIIRFNMANAIIVLPALSVLLLMLGYVTLENLGHLIG